MAHDKRIGGQARFGRPGGSAVGQEPNVRTNSGAPEPDGPVAPSMTEFGPPGLIDTTAQAVDKAPVSPGRRRLRGAIIIVDLVLLLAVMGLSYLQFVGVLPTSPK